MNPFPGTSHRRRTAIGIGVGYNTTLFPRSAAITLSATPRLDG